MEKIQSPKVLVFSQKIDDSSTIIFFSTVTLTTIHQQKSDNNAQHLPDLSSFRYDRSHKPFGLS